MDLSIILSIVAIVVSVIISGITLLLTEFQGPNISLISSPEFEVDYKHMSLKRKEQLIHGNIRGYAPTLFELKPTSFVFANHGGKSGTILAIYFEFSPCKEFRSYYRVFDAKLSFSPEGSVMPATSMPITIERGDNKVLFALANVLSLDWKRVALSLKCLISFSCSSYTSSFSSRFLCLGDEMYSE